MTLKVDFFIVGAQKSGTTALHSTLSRVDGIQMSMPKETHFFDNEDINWSQANYDSLNTYFDWSSENTIRGEATPIYSYWPESLERIHAYNPAAKFIMLLRQPALRAYSHWRMEFQRGSESLQFADAVSEPGRSRVTRAPGGIHPVYSYVERGFYSKQIKRIKNLFPDEQLIYITSEKLWCEPQEMLKKISRFLGVECSESASSRDYVAPLVDQINPIPPQENLSNLLHQLTNLYEEDIRETERLTGLLLSDWLDPDYEEPMVRP